MDEESMEISLKAYQDQLAHVSAALQASGTGGNQNLFQLEADLSELVQLTEESLLSLKKSRLLSQLEETPPSQAGTSQVLHLPHSPSPHLQNDDMDAEFAAFQAAIHDTKDEQEDEYELIQERVNMTEIEANSETSCSHECSDTDLSSVTGTRCRAPYSHQWGEKRYHSAMIMSVKPLEADKEPMVRVLFSHPTHGSMLPCRFFLDGRCHYNDEDCRFSHGYDVPVVDLQEYEDPDYNKLVLDSRCLSKDTDGVWYPATVVDVLDNESYKVMFDSTNTIVTVDIEELCPLEFEKEESDSESSSLSEQESEDEKVIFPVCLGKLDQTSQVMGEWEMHTKGIGSKLMARMGYIPGQGLGKNSEGRAEPVPIELLPSGKSLDKIMELKQLAGNRSIYDVLARQKRKQKMVDKRAAKQYFKSTNMGKKNVFDFINKKLQGKKGDINNLVKDMGKQESIVTHITTSDLHSRSERNINIQLLKTYDEIKKAETEMKQIQEAIKRNEGKDKGMVKQLEKKFSTVKGYLQQLKTSEHSIEKHKQNSSDKKKLTIF